MASESFLPTHHTYAEKNKTRLPIWNQDGLLSFLATNSMFSTLVPASRHSLSEYIDALPITPKAWGQGCVTHHQISAAFTPRNQSDSGRVAKRPPFKLVIYCTSKGHRWASSCSGPMALAMQTITAEHPERHTHKDWEGKECPKWFLPSNGCRKRITSPKLFQVGFPGKCVRHCILWGTEEHTPAQARSGAAKLLRGVEFLHLKLEKEQMKNTENEACSLDLLLLLGSHCRDGKWRAQWPQ